MTAATATEDELFDTDADTSADGAEESSSGVADLRVDAEVFPARQVRWAAWRVSGLVAWLVVVAIGAAVATGLLVGTWSSVAPADYHAVAAGGLMTLAGIVPAVLAAMLTGRPVARLDGGRIVLLGLSRVVVALYVVMWLAAFLVPLLSLVGTSAWLRSPGGIGVGLGLLVLTTLTTPVLFLVLFSRLSPRDSTLLAVARATRPAGDAPEAADARDRSALVKDLRDLTRSEYRSGDRRAVRYRMAGLATIAMRVPIPDVAEHAVEELGLACQEVALDRDMTREGIELLLEAALTVPVEWTAVVRRAMKELVDIWKSAAREGASPGVRHDAIEAAVRLARRTGDDALPMLAPLLTEMGEAPAPARERTVADMRFLESRVRFVALPAGPAAAAWVKARRVLNAAGFPLLIQRVTALTASGSTPESARIAAAAAAHLVMSHVRDTSLTDKAIRTAVKSAVQAGQVPALLRAAVSALTAEHPAPDPARGVLLAEIVRTLPAMSAEDLDTLVTTLTPLPDEVVLDRCAPALVPALDRVASTLLAARGDQASDELTLHRQRALVWLVTDVRSAAATRDPRGLPDLGELEFTFARLVRAARSSVLLPEPVDSLRRRTATLVNKVGAADPRGAALVAEPALPLLLTSGEDYGRSWLLWWRENGDAGLAGRIDEDWSGTLLPSLLAQRSTSLGQRAARLALPAGDPHATRGWTHGDAADAAAAALVELFAALPVTRLTGILTTVHRWVNAPSVAADDDSARAVSLRASETLAVLPAVGDDDPRFLLLTCHAAALQLSEHALWPPQLGGQPPDAERTAAAGAILRTAAPALLGADHSLAVQVLDAVVRAWWAGVTAGGHPVDAVTLSAVRQAALSRVQVRSFVEKGLRDETVPAELREGLRTLPFRGPGGGRRRTDAPRPRSQRSAGPTSAGEPRPARRPGGSGIPAPRPTADEPADAEQSQAADRPGTGSSED